MKTKQSLFFLLLSGPTIFAENIDFVPPYTAEKIEQWYLKTTKNSHAPYFVKAAISEATHHNCIPGSTLLVIKLKGIDFITLWDLSTGKLLHSFEGKEYPTFNNDYTILAIRTTNNAPHESRLYSVLTGKLLHTIEGKYPCFSPNGTYIITQTLEQCLEAQENTLWHVATGEPLYTLKGGYMCFSPDGTLLVVETRNDSTRKEELRVLNTANGTLIRTFKNGRPAFNPNGKSLTIKTYKGYDITWQVNSRLAN